MTLAALGLGLTQLLFLANIVLSLRRGEPSGENPWQAATLEWACPSPPPPGNFAVPPVVRRGPYDYSLPGLPGGKDFAPQDEAL